MRQGLRRVLLAGLAATGCAGAADAPREEEPPAPAAADTAAATPPVEERPEVVEGVLNLERSREPMTYRLFRSPEGFVLPFSTYVPEDMRVETSSSDEAQAVRFVAAFGGEPDERMYVSAHFPQAEMSTGEARARAREIAGSLGRAEPGAVEGQAWALESYRVQGRDAAVGTVALGRHAGRYFFVVTHYPAEAGDGFAPRARRVLDGWRWSEGGGLGT